MKITRKQLRQLIMESAPLYSTKNYASILSLLKSNKLSFVLQGLELGQYVKFEKTLEDGTVEMVPAIEPDSIHVFRDSVSGKHEVTAQINYVTLGYQLSIISRQGKGTYVTTVPYTQFLGEEKNYPVIFKFLPNK